MSTNDYAKSSHLCHRRTASSRTKSSAQLARVCRYRMHSFIILHHSSFIIIIFAIIIIVVTFSSDFYPILTFANHQTLNDTNEHG